MAITKGRCGGRIAVHGFCLTLLVLTVGVSACAGGGAAQPDGAGTGDPRPTGVGPSRPDQQGELQPVVSYAPTCTSAGEQGCLSGTEVQALEAFDGKLYVGTTNWEETLASVWPRTSAQINVLASQDGTWQRTPGLPGSPKCAPGNAPWEQVNDLHGAKFAWQGTTAKRLFAGVLANEDGACPGLQASVFYLDARGQKWINTGLDTRLEKMYGSVNSEVRYVETFSDGTTDCPAGRPCVFAFVGPRSGTIGPSVWRGIYDPADTACDLICWDSGPELVMDGIHGPPAARIVSSATGETGLYFGTTALGLARCGADSKGEDCNRAALMERVGPQAWEPAWLGSPARDGGPDQVRGIASWEYGDGAHALWFVTGPVGTVYRMDTTGGTRSAPVAERTLGEFLPESCNARMLPYQLYVHQRGSADMNPELLVASEACGHTPRDSFARIFHRPIALEGAWGVVTIPTVTSVGADRSNEAAVRWIETSPFDRKDVYFGTTDMNSTPGSLTARVYQLADPFE
jgi:hypothetical protein